MEVQSRVCPIWQLTLSQMTTSVGPVAIAVKQPSVFNVWEESSSEKNQNGDSKVVFLYNCISSTGRIASLAIPTRIRVRQNFLRV